MALPKIPSKLIRLALGDLELCEADDRYVIDMDKWHSGEHNVRCAVCLAGAVMAKTIGVSPDEETEPLDMEDRGQLEALDNFRTGEVYDAFYELGLDDAKGVRFERAVADYHDDPDLFKHQMEELANDLERKGF